LFLLSESRITRMTQMTRILRELAVKSTPHTYTVFGRDRGYKPLPQEKEMPTRLTNATQI
ncbi:MAG: hypothetical protein OXC79_06630, partial [Candidatus Poribacteria bacterium]|nr:hypothetical protein [Candidatus Poribacteria bacterium]